MLKANKEYGGYLPLELQENREYYQGDNVVSLNSARNAIVYACIAEGYTRIWLPYYLCDTVRDVLNKHNIDIFLYHIDNRYMPLDIDIQDGDVVLYVNYYGLIEESTIENLVNRYKNMIIDNTQAFFSRPIKDCYNVYSCRKFFGVPDGAYLVKEGIKKLVLEEDFSYSRSSYLLASYEIGTNGAYEYSLDNEEAINKSEIKKMSRLTHRIMASIDYEKVKMKRQNNYDFLYDSFNELGIEGIKRADDCIPMIYPLFANTLLRERVVARKIYSPCWWKYLLDEPINSYERDIIEKGVFLPIDQRYNQRDMQDVFSIVKEELFKDW